MIILVNIVIFLLIIGALVFVHEGGHYLAARLSGVKVEEFGIGFPPRIAAFKLGETEYSLNLIPIGGFCKLLGEEDPGAPRSLASKRPLTRFFVLAAGPMMNLIFPILLLTIAFMVPRDVTVGNILVDSVAGNSPAAEVGIIPGETIISINGNDVKNTGDLLYEIHLSLGEKTTIVLEQADGSLRTVTLIPRWDPPDGEGAMGVGFIFTGTGKISESDPFWEAVPNSFTTLLDTFNLFSNEVRRWFEQGSGPQVTGPVGLFQITGEATEAGPSYLLEFAAFFSVNLAIINLLPFPALDGGRILFVTIEMARRGKRVAPRTEGLIHVIGFAILLSFMAFMIMFEIIRWIRGESLF